MCNKHFLLQQSGTSFRFCLWSDEDDKCKLEGETVSQFPSCTVQPPSPPSPPPIRSFDYTDCMQPISSQGVDWCYQLPEDTECASIYRVDDSGRYIMCAPHETKDGRCVSTRTKLTSLPTMQPVDTQGVSWCYQLPKNTACGSFYQTSGARYATCVSHATFDARCTGGSQKYDTAPDCTLPPSPPLAPFDGCFRPVTDEGVDWCVQLPTGVDCAGYYHDNQIGKYVGCANHPTENKCVGGSIKVDVPPEPQC